MVRIGAVVHLPALLRERNLDADATIRAAGIDPALLSVLKAALSDDPAARPTAARFRDELAAVVLVPTRRP